MGLDTGGADPERKAGFFFLAHHPALDFVNTEKMGEEGRRDLIPDFPSLLSWLVAAGLLDPEGARSASQQWGGSEPARALTELAHRLRALLRQVAHRLSEAGGPTAEQVDALNRQLRRLAGHFALRSRGQGWEAGFQSGAAEPIGLLAPLAPWAIRLVTECEASRVKQCGNPGCILFFYDTSRNHARRWCSMSVCGNRMKVAAHYRRQRAKDKGRAARRSGGGRRLPRGGPSQG